MNYKIIKKLPDIQTIIDAFPLSERAANAIIQHRLDIKRILAGTDKRLLLIIGPCSAWPKEAAPQYAQNLSELNQQIKDSLKIIMRVYVQKPRSSKGWTGVIYQPDPLAKPDISAGLKYSRELLVSIAEMELPIAAEALFLHVQNSFLELLSWTAIGARSSENQEHRIFASALDMAVGMKNPTNGSVMAGLNSVIAAQASHFGVFNHHEVETSGNPFAHLVLRGGNHTPNYSMNHLILLQQEMKSANIRNPAIIIDASHENAFFNGKQDYLKQPQIIFDILNSVQDKPHIKKLIKGFMVESFLQDGKQSISSAHPLDLNGLSITDACLGWKKTRDFVLRLAEMCEHLALLPSAISA